MDRREFLTALSATAALPGAACATTGTAGSGTAGQTDRFLHDLASRDRLARSRASSPAVRRELRSRGLTEDHLVSSLSLLGAIKAIAEAPASVREDPRVQALAREHGTALGRHLIDSVDMLARLTPDDLDRVQRVVREHPDLVGQDAERHLRKEYGEHGATPQDEHRSVRLLRRARWQLTHQEPEAVVGGLIDRFDRIAQRQGLAQADEVPADGDETAPAKDRYVPHPAPLVLLKIGLVTAGAGALLFLAGLGLIYLDVPVGANLTVAGGVIIYAGLIVMALSGVAFGVDCLLHKLH